MLIKQLLNNAISKLTAISETPRLDAELLLTNILNKSRSFLYCHDNEIITDDEIHRFNELLELRAQGEPIAYLIGHKGFWNLDLEVDKNVLIPRPETELLVELVLQKFKDEKLIVADLGTGSGAIALSLAKERPHWQVFAVDSSLEALKVAKKNAQKLGISNVTFCHGDWLKALPNGKFNLIVSNPPYIAADDLHMLGNIRFEPKSALTSGPKGLDALTTIITDAKNVILPGGMLIFEHGYDQKSALIELMEKVGYSEIAAYLDYAGCDRVISGINS